LRTEFVNCRYTQSTWRANNMLIVDGQQLVRNVWFLEATESITQWRHNDGRLPSDRTDQQNRSHASRTLLWYEIQQRIKHRIVHWIVAL